MICPLVDLWMRPSVFSRPSNLWYEFFSAYRNVSLHLLQEEHGEVCPLGWTEGAKTIKPDPKGSIDYFSTVDDAPSNGHVNGSAKKRLRTD